MKFLPENTLAAFEAMPQKRLIDVSHRPLKLLATATREYKDNCVCVSPDIRAMEFYASNHFYSKIVAKFTRNETLPQWALAIAKAYRDSLEEQGERLMHYMVCIVTREARHLDSSKLTALTPALSAIGGQEGVEFVKLICGTGEMGAVHYLLDSPPDMTCGAYFRMIETLFNKGWTGKTSYGGKNWGNITRPLWEFLHGKISLEMLVDTAYTLAHNNGPMFNKGMMYENYSSGFKVLLDVQRSGQIPELVRTRDKYSFMKPFKIAGLTSLVELAYKHMPEEFGTFVDWQTVENCWIGSGQESHHKYTGYKDSQPKVAVPPPPPVAVLFKGQKAIEKQPFAITDQEQVKVFERIAA